MHNISIPFGGFYGSIHDALIDDMINNYYMDDAGEISEINQKIIDDNIDYSIIQHAYIIKYIDVLNEFLNDEFNTDVKFHNITLNSPRFYNFETDVILADISDLNIKKLIKIFDDDIDFLWFLNKETKSYDGFISFYTYDEAFNNKDNILIQYILKYICNELLNNDVFYSYYEQNNLSEIIFNVDFLKNEG